MEKVLDHIQIEGKPVEYSGFWLRVAAAIIDAIIISIVQAIITLGFFGTWRLDTRDIGSQTMSLVFIYYIIILLLNWTYYAGMESSTKQGTLGKMGVGIKVTDLNGERVSFGQATGRYFGKIISALIFGIGFLMVAFTEKKQGLHDQMAGTLVVKG